MIQQISAVGLLIALIPLAGLAQDKTKADDPLAGVKCIVAGDNAASIDHSVDYLDGKVYFCCDKCKTTFTENHEDYLVKANHQLAVTGQYAQKACPITGMDVKEGNAVSVGGVEVGLCCGRCKSSVAGAVDLEAKSELVFSHDAFAKGFEKVLNLDGITCPVGGGQVAEEFSAEYMGATVYFCCEKCSGTFAKDHSEYVPLANHQLASTGQFIQKNCPFSGMALKEEFQTKVGNVSVGFCCDGCNTKVANTKESEDQIKMVFNSDAFKKAFVSKNESSKDSHKE